MKLEIGNGTNKFNKTMIPLFIELKDEGFIEDILNNKDNRREVIDELIRNIYCCDKHEYADPKHQQIYEELLEQVKTNDKQKLYLFASLHKGDIEYMELEIKKITEMVASYTEAKQKI